MKAEWVEYTGSNEQIAEIMNKDSWLRLPSGREVPKSMLFTSDLPKALETITHYLICNPHTLADMIIRQAQTGQPVWVREHHENWFDGYLESTDCFDRNPTNTPDWNIPNAEYSFTPFED